MRVLIGTPTYADALRPETAASVKAQRFSGEWDWKVVDRNPYPAPDNRNVVAAYQHIRELFLAGDWDALLTVEHDMVLPPDALKRLWDTGAPVAYGVYLLRHGNLVLNACQYVGARNMGESLSLHRQRHKPRGVIDVSGVGCGCTLFRREVVERIPFSDGGDAGQSPDLPFAQACVRAGVRQVAHFDVLCGHIEKGRVLMPFANDKKTVRAVQTVTARVDGRSTPLVTGQTYEVPADEAEHLCRGGYAIEVDNTPAGDSDKDMQAPAMLQAEKGKLTKVNAYRSA